MTDKELIAELVEALKGFLEITEHRWRALPADTPEKKLMDRARAAVRGGE